MRRRFLIILGVCTAVVLLALALLPYWAGPAMKSIAGRYGVKIARYERLGYSRFAVHDVRVMKPNVEVQVSRAETETPLLWAFHHWFGEPALVRAGDWRVEVKPSAVAAPAPPKPATASGAMPLRATLFKVAGILERWLPRAEVGAGVVAWRSGELRIDRAEWKQRTLTVTPIRFREHGAEIKAVFASSNELLVEGRSVSAWPWQAALESAGDAITGELRVWDQPAPVSARFAAQGWMPAELQLRAESWAVPASELKLGQAYSTIRGTGRLEWGAGRFETSAQLSGEALPDKKAPPLSAKIEAEGTTDTVKINSLLIDVPGVNAELTGFAVFSRKPDVPSAPSDFRLAMDLEKQPWIPEAKGRIDGRAQLVPIPGKIPRIEAEMQAENLTVRTLSVAAFRAVTTLEWPRLQIREATLGFAEGGQLAARAIWDLRTNEITEASAEGVLRRLIVAQWLPEKLHFDTVTLDARARGPVAKLQHEGKASVAGFRMEPVNPLAADVSWTGVGAAVEVSGGEVRAGKSRLQFAGKLDTQSAQVSQFRLEQAGVRRLELAAPATIAWSPRVEVDSLQLTGDDAAVSLSASTGETGKLAASLRNFPSAWLTDFIAVPGPEWTLTNLDARASWNRGPAEFSVRGGMLVTLAPGRTANLSLVAQNERSGIFIESLRVSEGESAIVNASGRLPFSLHPGGPEVLRVEKGAPLSLHATTANNPEFWKKLTEATGLEFQEPEVNIDLAGTWERPQGTVTARARRLAADPARIKFAFPTVESLDLHATADGNGIVVERLAVAVEGQAVRASGKLPFTVKQWPEFKRAPVEFLRREASLHLEIPDAEVAAFSRYTGQYLAPSGRLHVDLTLSRGGEMTGALKLVDAVTRPLGPLGVLQEVQADAQLVGRHIEIKSVTARAGGQPVTLSGKVQLPLGAAPKFDLSLVGENFPLVRQTGLLMRADLDLKLVTDAENVSAVTGEVQLRESMFLSDVRALIPKGGGGGPARRPPFFAIETPPLNAWKLDVDVRGEEFLRLRSAVFVGVASARFHLGGTLGEPRATGEAVVDSGQVLLPFATFRVEQGTVRLTEADPYSLQLFLSGTSRRYGYDLRMEITGSAAEPLVTFSSSPPLDAKQVLLMVTAGEVPNDQIAYGGAQRAAKLGTYLGQSLINNFGGDSTDADRLNISTGERVSRQGRETYNIEYQLNDRVTVVGEYDEFDAYNAGVKWRLFAPKKDGKKTSAQADKKEAGDVPPR